MTRYFLSIIISALFLVACHNSLGREDVTFIIDTETLYTDLNLKEEMQSQLSTKSGVIVDSVFIYGETGKLVARIGMEVSSLAPTASLSLPQLENGIYTVVVYQSFKKADGQCCWHSADAENISTLSIQHNEMYLDYYWALGVAKETITVNDGLFKTTLQPKAAGSIVEFQLDGYTKDLYDPIDEELPPIWLYGESEFSGLYPGQEDNNRWFILADQPGIIGYLNEASPYQKFFTLMNGDGKTISVKKDKTGWVYYQDEINLYPGSIAICYFDFSPESFYYAYCGTLEGAMVFKAEQVNQDCSLFPYVKWGASRWDVEQYLSSRTFYPCQPEQIMKEGDSFVQYYIAPGLSETYAYLSPDTDKLSGVSFKYEGIVPQSEVEACMQKQGYRYIGQFPEDYYLGGRLYKSPDGQTEFIIQMGTDVIPAKGFQSWNAFFLPVNHEDLAMLGE